MHTHAALCLASSITHASLPIACRHPSVDVHHEVVDVLHIDTVRALRQLAYQAPTHDTYRWLVVCAQTFTHPAQNALLKLLEDPPPRTKIVLVAVNSQQLLPTVRSRLEYLPAAASEHPVVVGSDTAAVTWLASTVADRLEQIAVLHKQGQGQSLADLLTAVLGLLPRQPQTWTPAQRKLVADIAEFSQRSGASRKYLLEAFALAIPPIAVVE